MTDNVIQFPKGKLNTPPQSLEEMVADIDRLRRETADEIATSMIPQLIGIFMAQLMPSGTYPIRPQLQTLSYAAIEG